MDFFKNPLSRIILVDNMTLLLSIANSTVLYSLDPTDTHISYKSVSSKCFTYFTGKAYTFFAPSEAADIKGAMQEYGETAEQQKTVGAWLCGYAVSRQPFDEIKHRHTLNEVDDVAEGKYDWKIERELDNNLKV